MTSDVDYVRRAMAAWFRYGGIASPNSGSSTYEADGRRYVELWNSTSGTLAVYRIENCGRLRRVKIWPPLSANEYRPTSYHFFNEYHKNNIVPDTIPLFSDLLSNIIKEYDMSAL